MSAFSWTARPGTPYAVLDVVDGQGDILQTFPIPHARAFRWFYRKLRLRVESEDGR